MDLCHNKTRKNGSLLKKAIFFVGLIAVLYSILWFFLTYLLHDYVGEELQHLNEGRAQLECENLRKSGYPLRLGLTCDRLRWRDEVNGYSLTTGGVIAGAPLYAPSWQFAELSAPLYFDAAGFGQIEVLWHSLVLTTHITDEVLQDLAVSIDNFHLTFEGNQHNIPAQERLSLGWEPVFGTKKTGETKEQAWLSESLSETKEVKSTLVAEADFVHLKIRKDEQRLKVFLSFDALRLPDNYGDLPTTTGELVLNLERDGGVFDIFDKGNSPLADLLRGRSGQLEKMELHFASGGGVFVEGAFHISFSGTLSGQLNMHLFENAALLRTMRTYFPKQAHNLESLFFALNAMPKDAQGNPILTITLDEGRLRMGFIPLGVLPSF